MQTTAPDHPVIRELELYGEPKNSRCAPEIVESFGKPESVELLEDLEDELKWEIRKVVSYIAELEKNLNEHGYDSHRFGMKGGAEFGLDSLKYIQEIVQEMKENAE